MEEEEKNRRLKIEQRKRKEEEKLEKQRLKVPDIAFHAKSKILILYRRKHLLSPIESENLDPAVNHHRPVVIKQIHNSRKMARKLPLGQKMAKMIEFLLNVKVHYREYDRGYQEVVKVL